MINRTADNIDYEYVESGILQITFSNEKMLKSMDRAMHQGGRGAVARG